MTSGRASQVSLHTVGAEPTKRKINPVLGRYGVSGEKGGDADGNGNQGLVRYSIKHKLGDPSIRSKRMTDEQYHSRIIILTAHAPFDDLSSKVLPY